MRRSLQRAGSLTRSAAMIPLLECSVLPKLGLFWGSWASTRRTAWIRRFVVWTNVLHVGWLCLMAYVQRRD